MAGKAYNAGTIFLQVVPVFDQLQNQIRDEAKKANGALKQEMREGGREAGREAGKGINEELAKAGKEGSEKYSGAFARDFRDRIRGLNKELSGTKINIGVEDENVQRTFTQIEARAKALRNVKIGVDVSSREAAMELAKIEVQLKLLQEQASDIEVKANLKTAHAQIRAFVAEVQKAHPEIKIDADFKEAQRALGAFQADFQAKVKKAAASLGDSINPEVRKIRDELAQIGDLEIGVDIDDAEAKATIAYMHERLSQLDGDEVEVHVRANVGIAIAQLELLQAKIREVDGQNIDVDTGQMKRSLGDAADNFRALNLVMLAAVTLIPALIPLIAALGGALLALGPAIAGVGAGFGVMVLGFSGIGNAVQALGQQQKTGAKDTEASANRIRKASESIADAERSLSRTRQDVARRDADAARAVADAKRSSAQSIKDAARQVSDAERSSAEAVKAALRQRSDAVRNAAKADRDATRAQLDLLNARKLAQKELQDNADNLAQNKLDERQAVIDLFNATVTDTAARQDGGTTNLEREQASINLASAQLRLKNIREEREALQAKDKAGVKGSDTVQNAQDALTSALERQKAAHEAVGEADRKVNEARIEGARRVAEAVAAQQRAQAAGARAVADAERNQARSAADGQRSIADAQRSLTRAQEDYQAALKQTPASVAAVEDAMNKLGPAGQRFARFLFGLRQGFYDIRDAAQQQMLPAVQGAMETIMAKYGKAFPNFVTKMSRAIGDLFRDFGKMMTNPLWSRFFGMIDDLGPKFTKQFGKGLMNWMSVFARLMIIAAPWAEKLSTALLGVSKHALAFVNSKKGTKVITDFLGYAEKVGPKVWGFLKDLWDAAVNLGKALAPLGVLILGALGGILKMIANMDPKVLGAIVIGIITFVAAFQALNGIVAIAAVGMKLWSVITLTSLGPVLLIVGGIILLVGLLVALYTQSETARKIMDAVFHAIGATFKWLWDTILKPFFDYTLWVWGELGRVFKWVWDRVLHPVFTALGTVFKWLWEKIVKPYLGFVLAFWTTVFKAMKWVWDNVLWPVIDLFGTAIRKLYEKFFKTAVEGMHVVWKWLGDKLGPVYTKYIKPVIDKLATAIGATKTAFGDAVDAIGRLWDTLRDKLAKPINWVIKKVFNEGIIAGFNKIAGFVGSDKMGLIPLINTSDDTPKKSPKNAGGSHGGALNNSFATGGIMPGYTPGRDVHHFFSPTAGSLHLSGGEPILRPEVGKVVGSGWVHSINKAARLGGTDAVRRFLGGQGFARGGVFWPVPGRTTSTYANHDGVDINRGSGWTDYGDPIRAFRPGQIVYVGTGKGYGQAIFEKVDGGPTVVYGHTSRTNVRAGQHVLGGQLIGAVGNTGNSSAPHLHFGIPGGTFGQALALLQGASVAGFEGAGATGGGFHLPGWMSKVIGAPLKWAAGLAEKGLDGLADRFGGNGFVKLLTGLGNKVVHIVADKVQDLVAGVGDMVAGGSHVASSGAQAIVQKMAAARGWVGAQWNALSEIVQRESGWNPNAANPVSSARGLFQKMTSIHGAIESTVQGQALWGLNYIAGRYGNPLKALAYWDAHGSYADGGIVGGETSSEASGAGVASNGTMMYDNGGYLPPGLTTVLNLTGKPEPVFTADQFSNLGRDGGEAGGFTYAPTFNASDLTAADVAQDLEFAMRKHGKLGKYGSRG